MRSMSIVKAGFLKALSLLRSNFQYFSVLFLLNPSPVILPGAGRNLILFAFSIILIACNLRSVWVFCTVYIRLCCPDPNIIPMFGVFPRETNDQTGLVLDHLGENHHIFHWMAMKSLTIFHQFPAFSRDFPRPFGDRHHFQTPAGKRTLAHLCEALDWDARKPRMALLKIMSWAIFWGDHLTNCWFVMGFFTFFKNNPVIIVSGFPKLFFF